MISIKPISASVSALALCLFSIGCSESTSKQSESATPAVEQAFAIAPSEIYKTVALTTDLDQLTDLEKEVLPILIDAADVMNGLFWKQSYGDKSALMAQISNEDMRQYAEINYGPWDRLDDNAPFVPEVGSKPAGAQFYPADMDTARFNQWLNPHKLSPYTIISKDSEGKLKHTFYHAYYQSEVEKAAGFLEKAALLLEQKSNASKDRDLAYFLKLRAEALRTDRYNPSDIAWLGLENNTLDIIIGPIESYEDHLYGSKAAYEAYVLVKDQEWTEKLKIYKSYLPDLQKGLPVEKKYKQDKIGGKSQLGAYDVVYYAGDCNAGSKTIAVNLPNDAELQQNQGTRRSQLKNAMKAKYEEILVPIADILITPEQRQHITFNAFFANTMFHEVAHGLGIKNTVNGKGTVSEALKELHSPLEEGKADILGLYMITELLKQDALEEGGIMDYYVTFLAGIFRSVRFGASSAHGKANMLRFNYFEEQGAFSFDATNQTFSVNLEAMKTAVESLSREILTIQGDGDYVKLSKWMQEQGAVSPELQVQLDRLSENEIPKDIIFKQGSNILF